MTPTEIIQHLERWLQSKEDANPASSWGNGYQRAIEDVQLEIERLKGLKAVKPYEFSREINYR